MRIFTVCSLTWIAGAIVCLWRRWHDTRPLGRSERSLLRPFLTPAARARVDAEEREASER